MDERHDRDSRGERLHKILARAGVASRRDCEKLIAEGRVQVDGETVTQMGLIVDPLRQSIAFDGETIRAEKPAYFVVYKPKGVVCTTKDQFDRTSVVDLVRDRHARRLFPVGRMEEDSEGLILVTNDGAFANTIVSHRHPLRYLYYVRVRGQLTQDALKQVREGLWLSDGKSGPMWVKVRKWGKKVSTIMCQPSAQQHRVLKRVWSRVGLVADRVVRVRIGALTTENLKKGAFRRLTDAEVDALLNPSARDIGIRSAEKPGRLPPWEQRETIMKKRQERRDERRRQKQASRDSDEEQKGPRRRVIGP